MENNNCCEPLIYLDLFPFCHTDNPSISEIDVSHGTDTGGNSHLTGAYTGSLVPLTGELNGAMALWWKTQAVKFSMFIEVTGEKGRFLGSIKTDGDRHEMSDAVDNGTCCDVFHKRVCPKLLSIDTKLISKSYGSGDPTPTKFTYPIYIFNSTGLKNGGADSKSANVFRSSGCTEPCELEGCTWGVPINFLFETYGFNLTTFAQYYYVEDEDSIRYNEIYGSKTINFNLGNYKLKMPVYLMKNTWISKNENGGSNASMRINWSMSDWTAEICTP
jgi:hypothetical protein